MTTAVIEKARRNKSTTDAVTEAMAALSRAVNVMGQEEAVAEAIANALMSDHRTLQQGMVRAITKALTIYGKEARTDLRNEGAVSLCRKITPAIEESPMPFI